MTTDYFCLIEDLHEVEYELSQLLARKEKGEYYDEGELIALEHKRDDIMEELRAFQPRVTWRELPFFPSEKQMRAWYHNGERLKAKKDGGEKQ